MADIPEIINLGGYMTAGITALVAVVSIAVGGYFAFLIIRKGVYWAGFSMGGYGPGDPLDGKVMPTSTYTDHALNQVQFGTYKGQRYVRMTGDEQWEQADGETSDYIGEDMTKISNSEWR